MFAKRMLALFLAVFCLAALFPLARASDGGQETDVLQPQVDCDSVYCFSPEDFGEDLTGICITGLPDSSAGTILLGQRVVRTGDILTTAQARNITIALVAVPVLIVTVWGLIVLIRRKFA